MSLTPIKLRHGKDRENHPGLEIDGVFFENIDLIYALACALFKKGVLTKAEIKAELSK